MTGATEPDGISFMETGDFVDPVTESAVQASSIQAALNNRVAYNYNWPTVTERTAQQNMRPGDTGYQVDTNAPYIYAGLNLGWLPVGFGTGRQWADSVLVTPTGSTTNWSGTFQVSFPPGYFTATPVIQVTPFTAHPGQVFASYGTPTSAGFTIYLQRTDSAPTTVSYHAIQVT